MGIFLPILIFLFGGIVSYFAFMPKRQKTYLNNLNIEELEKTRFTLTTDIEIAKETIKTLNDKKESLQNDCDKINKYYEERLEEAVQKFSSDYEKANQEYENEYLNNIAAFTEKFNLTVDEKNQELAAIVKQLNSAQAKQAAIVEAFKREEQKANEANFYRLQLSDEDIQEVEKLEEIAVYFRNSEPLYKIIWKTYYEKAFTDLIGRIASSDNLCGIYKITNLKNQKSYIGQSVNIKDRLRTHIKKGLGADVSGRNKLYTAMRQDKVENFSYEIVELCSREQLNDRERYWIDFYKTQEYGYNETKGGS